MSKKISPALWVLADPIDRLKPGRDSTLFWISLMSKTSVYWLDEVDTGGVKFRRIQVRYSRLDFVTPPEIEWGPVQSCDWKQVKGKLLFRLDPPVTGRYRALASFLATRESAQLKILNNPLLIAAMSEKLLPLLGGDEIPFHLNGRARAGQIIKDLWGFGGTAVRQEKGNAYSLLPDEIAQDFSPDIRRGERRVYIVGSQLHGVLVKTPNDTDFRSNYQWGSQLAFAKPSAFELKRSQFYQRWLRARGVELATVDFIGKKIVEVNITCPGLLYPTALLQGYDGQRHVPFVRNLIKQATP